MTAYQLFRGLTGVDGELLAAVELVDSRKKPATKKLPARKIWLVAAVVALALLLAGCGIAYVLSLRQLELGTQTIPLPTDASQDGTAPTETEMQLTVFSLQGIEGTPNYQANQEWLYPLRRRVLGQRPGLLGVQRSGSDDGGQAGRDLR